MVTGDKEPKRNFKTYPIGYFHIDIAEVQTAEGKLRLFLAIDRTSKFAPLTGSGQALSSCTGSIGSSKRSRSQPGRRNTFPRSISKKSSATEGRSGNRAATADIVSEYRKASAVGDDGCAAQIMYNLDRGDA